MGAAQRWSSPLRAIWVFRANKGFKLCSLRDGNIPMARSVNSHLHNTLAAGIINLFSNSAWVFATHV